MTSVGTVTTISNGAVDLVMLSATGTPSSSTFLRGDYTWALPPGGIASIVAGEGIDIDNTDPQNPVISNIFFEGIYDTMVLEGIKPLVPLTLDYQPLYFNSV